MRATRVLILAAGAVAAVVLFLVLRPDADDPPRAETTRATAETRPVTDPARGATTRPAARRRRPPRPQAVIVPIRIRDGRPVGGVRHATVKRGRQVRLVVRSDTADHVHVHGYDLFRDVAPGAPAQLAFRATIAGRFEIELEDRGLQIAELEVRP